MSFTHVHRVGFHHTDAAGVVYFAHGLVLCHIAYEASLAAAGVDLTQFFPRGAIAPSPRLAYPIVHASIDFRGAIAAADQLAITLTPRHTESSAFEIDYTLALAAAPERSLVTALTRHVCLLAATRQRQPLPPELLNWLQQFGDRAIK